MKQTIFIKRFVATDGLPKKDGYHLTEYLGIATQTLFGYKHFIPNNQQCLDDWNNDVIWWQEERELPDDDDIREEISKRVKVDGFSGVFMTGANWLKQLITK